MKVIRIFNAQPVKIPYFNTPLTCKQARWPHFFYCIFLMFISWMSITPSFKKSLIVEQFQGNYLKNTGWPIKFRPENLHYSLVKKTLYVMDTRKQQKRLWWRRLRWPLSCLIVPSVQKGCGSSRSWRSDLSEQDESFIFRPVQQKKE